LFNITWGMGLFRTTVFLQSFYSIIQHTPSQRSKYTGGVVRRMRRCVVNQRLSRKCVQKKNTPGPSECSVWRVTFYVGRFTSRCHRITWEILPGSPSSARQNPEQAERRAWVRGYIRLPLLLWHNRTHSEMFFFWECALSSTVLQPKDGKPIEWENTTDWSTVSSAGVPRPFLAARSEQKSPAKASRRFLATRWGQKSQAGASRRFLAARLEQK